MGRYFVDALARKVRKGVAEYAIFGELANLGQSADFEDFSQEIQTPRFRSFSGPADAANPRTGTAAGSLGRPTTGAAG